MPNHVVKHLVVCEATGGLEYLHVDALHDAKVDVVVANPARVRDFAKGRGYFEKSDAIDARMLQLYVLRAELWSQNPLLLGRIVIVVRIICYIDNSASQHAALAARLSFLNIVTRLYPALF